MKNKVCSAESLRKQPRRRRKRGETTVSAGYLKTGEKIFWICSHSIEYKAFGSNLAEGTATCSTRPTLTPSRWDMEEQKPLQDKLSL